MCLHTKMKFLGQGCQKLEHEQDRHRQTDTQTDRQMRPNALPSAFVGGNKDASAAWRWYSCYSRYPVPSRLTAINKRLISATTKRLGVTGSWVIIVRHCGQQTGVRRLRSVTLDRKKIACLPLRTGRINSSRRRHAVWRHFRRGWRCRRR